jgi:agmatine deiminase
MSPSTLPSGASGASAPPPAGTPAALGYRMPAEWEPHAATWLSWPRADGISFPGGGYARAVPALVKMVAALADSEPVHINVTGPEQEAEVRRHLETAPGGTGHVRFFHIPTNEPWCRDHGPIFVTRDADPRLAAVDFDYNAWGWKYPPFDLDDAVPGRMAEAMGGLPLHRAGMVLEGGSIDVNGSGSLLTTESCLLNVNRNPNLKAAQIEAVLRAFLGVKKILWLGAGIEGDDTDGHVDDLTRFVNRTTVVTVIEEDPLDANHEPLQANLERLREMATEDGSPLHVLTMPMPSRIVREGQRLPASYANFYVANKVVLMPSFNEPHDGWALAVMKQAFPTRRIVPINCRELIWGLGAFHCLTQQQPALEE